MVRNFVTGIFWGGLVSVVGLGTLSQMVPPPAAITGEGAADAGLTGDAGQGAAANDAGQSPKQSPEQTPEQTAVPEANPVTPDADAPTPDTEAADASPPAAAAAPQPLAEPSAETDEPLLLPLADVGAPSPAAVVPDLPLPAETGTVPASDTAPDPAPETAPETAPPNLAAQDPADEAPAGTGAEMAATPAEESAETAPIMAADPVPAEDPAVAEDGGTEDGGTAMAESAPMAPETQPEETQPEETPPETMPQIEAADPTPAEPMDEPALATLAPDSGLAGKTVDGVTTGRLPSIGTEAAGAAALPPSDAPPAADLPPVQRFARRFDNPTAKPLFAILLIDPGTADLNRADLAALPFAVTFVVDPMIAGAREAAAIYRAAGQEVVMLATGIPKGANASDLEQSFAGLDGAVPEAVALIDTAQATFQDNRLLAAEVVTHLSEEGLGLVTFDRGLNAADQVARREGLPAATIFRSLDDDGEEGPLIRRYLDRAAFKAAQEGQVVVIGTARAETIGALMEWAVEGRSASVALAPITAVMKRN